VSPRRFTLPPALAERYEIRDELPPGGIGRVYRATQLKLQRMVVIKVLRSELADSPEHIARFRQEAQTLARLDHENIVRIFDIEEDDGLCCIIMENLAGGSLAQLLARSGRLEPRRACEIALVIADALASAHAKGIIHRDLKPGNVLLSASGRPKLADFGIARLVDTATSTRSELLGTPHYMSPEQVRGEKVAPVSDLYSLGVVLYEMLTGRVPFLADTPFGVALKHVQEPPPDLAATAPHLPPALRTFVHRALAKDPADRFDSAEAFSQHLLEAHPTGEPPPRQTGGLECPECGQELQPSFLTCPRCARPVARVCPGCARQYDPIAPACPHCGSPAPVSSPQSPGARRAGPGRGIPAGVAAGQLAVQVGQPPRAGEPRRAQARVRALAARPTSRARRRCRRTRTRPGDRSSRRAPHRIPR
jgi:serine/threonine protein kinase